MHLMQIRVLCICLLTISRRYCLHSLQFFVSAVMIFSQSCFVLEKYTFFCLPVEHNLDKTVIHCDAALQ